MEIKTLSEDLNKAYVRIDARNQQFDDKILSFRPEKYGLASKIGVVETGE